MPLTRSSLLRTLTTLVVSGCFGGTGSGLTGIAGGTGGQARTLSFAVQPSDADTGDFITPAIQIAALNTASQVDTSFAGSVSVTLATNTTGATLGGTTSTIAVAGVATFGDLHVNRVGSYALRAAGGNATAATSAGFTISLPAPLRSAP